MRKPEVGAPIRTEVPVLRLGTDQAHDPDAFGQILPQFDAPGPSATASGSTCEPGADHAVEGWIVFRGDAPAASTSRSTAPPVAATATFEAGAPYRDWGAAQTAFSAAVDLSRVAPGRHSLGVTVGSAGGRSHAMTIPLTVL